MRYLVVYPSLRGAHRRLTRRVLSPYLQGYRLLMLPEAVARATPAMQGAPETPEVVAVVVRAVSEGLSSLITLFVVILLTARPEAAGGQAEVARTARGPTVTRVVLELLVPVRLLRL